MDKKFFTRLMETYSSIVVLLHDSQEQLKNIYDSRYQLDKEKILVNDLTRSTNRRLKRHLDSYFDYYEKLNKLKADYLDKLSNIDQLQEIVTDSDRLEKTKDIPGLLERFIQNQQIMSLIDRMTDSELIGYYDKSVKRAQEFRAGIITDVEAEQINIDDAIKAISENRDIAIVKYIEAEKDILVKEPVLKKTLSGMVEAQKLRRISSDPISSDMETADKSYSRLCFLLRDMSDSALKIKDWNAKDIIFSDLSDSQVSFFIKNAFAGLENNDEFYNQREKDIQTEEMSGEENG